MVTYTYTLTALNTPTPYTVYLTEEDLRDWVLTPPIPRPPYWGLTEDECVSKLEVLLNGNAGTCIIFSVGNQPPTIFTKIPPVDIPDDLPRHYLYVKAAGDKLKLCVVNKEQLTSVKTQALDLEVFTKPEQYLVGRAAQLSESEIAMHFNPRQLFTRLDLSEL